jgi:hypothetical protein
MGTSRELALTVTVGGIGGDAPRGESVKILKKSVDVICDDYAGPLR